MYLIKSIYYGNEIPQFCAPLIKLPIRHFFLTFHVSLSRAGEIF